MGSVIRSFARIVLFGGAIVLAAFALATAARAAECGDCASSAFRPAAMRMELPSFGAPAALPWLPDLTPISTARGDVRVEASLRDAATATLGSSFDADVQAVEERFGHALQTRPTVYAFATSASFAAGLRAFGYDATVSEMLAREHGGVFDPARVVVLLNWERLGAASAPSVLQHELAHAMVHQLVGDAPDLPAWLDEGIASSLEIDGPTEKASNAAISLVALGRAPLAGMRTPTAWLEQDRRLGGYGYSVSVLAVGSLEATIGRPALVESLAAGGEIGSVEAGFERVAGLSLRDFEASFGTPSAATLASASTADGLTYWWLRGFEPGTTIRVSIDGLAYHLSYDVIADEAGTYWATFGAPAPSGEYRIEASAGTLSASALVHVEDR